MEFNNIQNPILTSPSELFKKKKVINQNPTNILQGLKLSTDNISLTNYKSEKILSNLIETQPIKFSLNSLISTNIKTNVGISNFSANKIVGLPLRSANAITGSQFINVTRNMSRPDREKAILQEINKGNIPDFVRNLKDVNISMVDDNGQKHNATIHVAPDYLAIGSNEDFIRIPMNPITAQKIADQTGTILPTKKMVDQIYQQATAKMSPQPMQASSKMMSNEYYENHNNMVEQQRDNKGYRLGQLTAGHQKDVVITNQLDKNTGKVAIYGWHRTNGKAIQPLSTIHENTYEDYSHGIRLISKNITVDGKKMNIDDVLKDPNLSKLLSDEGVIQNSRASR
ncbi:MAG: hypothetical protein H7263_17125 [Candidatus Sericytochromatia bacterium]|nr:hypothetical protein [Candidatus Sericytochromatia bacterium]